MSSQLVRLASFAPWPSTAAVSSLALARSGFKYTGHGESTVCTECQLVVDSWQQGDRPDQVHRQRSPSCTFVREHLQANDSSTSSSSPATASGATAIESQPSSTAGSIDRAAPDFESLKIESVPLETWEQGDRPAGKHRMCLPHCFFVKQQGVDVGGIPGPPTQYVCHQFFFK